MPTADFGIVYESDPKDCGLFLKRRNITLKATDPWHTPMGSAVFETYADRDAAMQELRSLGYTYLVTYRDTQGPGLMYAERMDHFYRRRCLAVRRGRRMPRVRR